MLFSDIDTTYITNVIQGLQGKKLILWGAGRRLKGFVEQYCGDGKLLPQPFGVCDSTRDIPESTLHGIPVLPFSAVQNMLPKDTVIIITAGLLDLQAKVVASELYYFPLFHCRTFEVYDYLQQHMAQCDDAIRLLDDPFSKKTYRACVENILCGRLWDQSTFSPSPYFGNDINGKLDDAGQLVFAGAFNGKHLDRAIENNPAMRIAAFEPSKTWSAYLREKFKDAPQVSIHNKILWNENALLSFDDDMSNSGLDAHVCAAGANSTYQHEGVAIDDYIEGKVSMIALDVEGSEQKVIKGAHRTIERDRPKLCICLYHNLDDYFRIPVLIREQYGYQLHVKHHSTLSAIETVLYAV